MQTAESKAALAEGRGLVLLAGVAPAQAADAFHEAVAGWESLDRLLDQVRALGGLGLALADRGDDARTELDHALDICDALATQLDDASRESFARSATVRQLRNVRRGRHAAMNAV